MAPAFSAHSSMMPEPPEPPSRIAKTLLSWVYFAQAAWSCWSEGGAATCLPPPLPVGSDPPPVVPEPPVVVVPPPVEPPPVVPPPMVPDGPVFPPLVVVPGATGAPLLPGAASPLPSLVEDGCWTVGPHDAATSAATARTARAILDRVINPPCRRFRSTCSS